MAKTAMKIKQQRKAKFTAGEISPAGSFTCQV